MLFVETRVSNQKKERKKASKLVTGRMKLSWGYMDYGLWTMDYGQSLGLLIHV
jgi:hypothetical protein